MKIGIDASRYGHETSTGVEWYSYHLLNELIPMFGRDHNDRVTLFSPREFVTDVDLPFNVRKKIMPLRRLWTTLRLSVELFLHPVDILFVPSHTLPLFFPKKSVITIHDLAFKKIKNSYDRLQLFLLNRATRVASKKAWKIIVPSEATKKDLIEIYKCPSGKIYVIPHGAPNIPKLRAWNETVKNKMLKRFGLEENDLCVLFIGRLETKKNLCRLIEGFQRFLKEFPDWKLVLAGKDGIGAAEVHAKIAELDLKKQVITPGYISEEEKRFLYDYCRITAMPSLYEGFGLPILEAFAYHRPILASNNTSIPEVAGGAAYLVDPYKTEEIGVGLKRLASDGMLVSELILKGEKQLKKFDWEKTAEKTYEVLKD